MIVVTGTAVIVNLAGGRPTASSAMGYMPTTATSYVEVRLDLPGDQRQKLAAFLANFPGFKDQSQVEPKLNDVLDRIDLDPVREALGAALEARIPQS